FAQLGVDVAGVVAALAGENHVQGLELIDAVGVLQRRGVLADFRALATHVGRCEEHGLDQVEVPFLTHALHEHGTHHAPPADQTYTFHLCNYTSKKVSGSPSRRTADPGDYRFRSAATTASPISRVPALRQPSDQMSPVRRRSEERRVGRERARGGGGDEYR